MNNFKCEVCGGPVSSYQARILIKGWDYIQCNRCGHSQNCEIVGLNIDPRCTQFQDKRNVREAMWYHVSTVDPDEWRFELDFPYKPATHVGTKITTRWYRKDNLKHRSVRTYQFRIIQGAVISDDVVVDDNVWTGYSYLLQDGEYDVLRYINRYESPGQISLLVNPAALELISVGRKH